jgi:hypothetical protein
MTAPALGSFTVGGLGGDDVAWISCGGCGDGDWFPAGDDSTEALGYLATWAAEHACGGVP